MRTAAVLLMVFLGLWIVAGAPVPLASLAPLETDPDAPTFQEASEDLDPAVRARKYGSAPEDPVRRQIRLAIIDAAEQARLSPCNEQFRQRLVAASKDLIDVLRTKVKVEVTFVNGRQMNVSEKLDKTALDAFNTAMTSGFFRPEDFTGRYKDWGKLIKYYGKGNPCQ